MDTIEIFKAGKGIHSSQSCPSNRVPLCTESSGAKHLSAHVMASNVDKIDVFTTGRVNGQTKCDSENTEVCGDDMCVSSEGPLSGRRVECCDRFTSFDCFCLRINPPMCSTSENCPKGEVCIRITVFPRMCFGEDSTNLLILKNSMPVQIINKESDDIISNGKGNIPPGQQNKDENVCISVVELGRHVRREDFIFPKDRQATVLCDAHDSCATPGHMVVFRGSAMRMSSYCLIVRCESRVMMVNSPRYKAKMTLPSSTHGLTYTGLAARHDTMMEEIILKAAIRLGI